MKKVAELRAEIDGWQRLQSRISEAIELAELDDEGLRPDLEAETAELEKEVHARQLDTLLSGPHDTSNALLTINSGMGGADSNDWAAMLERMYLRWAERR